MEQEAASQKKKNHSKVKPDSIKGRAIKLENKLQV